MAPVILGILLVLVPLPLSAEAQIRGNFSAGSSLTANGRNSSLLSPSGEFAFGFREMGRGAHLLAIWFEKIEDKTIVWSANGDNLAPEGSKVQLTADGGLVLADPKGRELWSVTLTGSGVAYAAMLDAGNLIVASGNHVKLWDPFSHPTDTILPTQRLDQGTTVNARYSEINYSPGRFHFILQTDGDLVFYVASSPGANSDKYWTSNTSDSSFQLIFNQSGQVYLTARNGTVLRNIFFYTFSSSELYCRAILEYDGVLGQYVHPKMPNSTSGRETGWSLVSSPIPLNICKSIRRRAGSGACGFNSYCTLGDDKIQRPRCQCPPGYTLLDSTNEMNGCRQDFVSQSCDGSRPENDQFILQDMLNTDWIYQELQEATGGFKEELGRGAFGAVYKGVLRSEDANFMAVKVLGRKTGESKKEFEREVSTVGQTNHKNLVQLLGFCNEGQHQLLVCEFMSNGSLADFHFGSSRPSWYKRIDIACGVARGLSYL